MYIHEIKIRVRYGETDKMGYLYYGNYALFYEQGRTDAIRNLGLTYKSLEEAGIIMPVIALSVKYLRPAFYDDLITVKTIVKVLEEPDQTINFYCELYNERGKKLNESVTTLVFFDQRIKKKVSMPPILKEKLEPYFQS